MDVKLRGDDELEVERHRPERWWDLAVVGGICCSCCCCCCCCAHTVGAAAGAAAGSVRSLAKTSNDPEARKGTLAATLAYWGGVGAVGAVSLLLAVLAEETLLGLIVIAMLAPVLQLAGSVIALPTILLQPTSKGRRAAASAIGATTLGWFIGGTLGAALIAGLLVMVVFFAGAAS